MIDLTPIINAVIALLAAIVVRYVVPFIKAKTTEKQREDMLVWVDIAVTAAQQLYYQSSGDIRLNYALNLLRDEGFNVDEKSVRDAVEAAVLKLHQGMVNNND